MQNDGNPGRHSRAASSSSSTSIPGSPNVELAASALDQLGGTTRRKGTDLTDSQSTGACSSAHEASETEFGLSTSPNDREQPAAHLAIADNLANLMRDAAQRASELAASSQNASHKPLSRHLSTSSLSACETDSTCTGTATGTDTAFESRVSSIAMSRTTSLPLIAPAGDIPSIDPHVVKDLETHAKRISSSVTQLLSQVRVAMHKISAVTACGLQTYEEAALRTCSTVDNCIRAMYAALACCDKVALEMTRVAGLHAQLREISRQLDALESVCGVKPMLVTHPGAPTPSRSAK